MDVNRKPEIWFYFFFGDRFANLLIFVISVKEITQKLPYGR